MPAPLPPFTFRGPLIRVDGTTHAGHFLIASRGKCGPYAQSNNPNRKAVLLGHPLGFGCGIGDNVVAVVSTDNGATWPTVVVGPATAHPDGFGDPGTDSCRIGDTIYVAYNTDANTLCLCAFDLTTFTFTMSGLVIEPAWVGTTLEFLTINQAGFGILQTGSVRDCYTGAFGVNTFRDLFTHFSLAGGFIARAVVMSTATRVQNFVPDPMNPG